MWRFSQLSKETALSKIAWALLTACNVRARSCDINHFIVEAHVPYTQELHRSSFWEPKAPCILHRGQSSVPAATVRSCAASLRRRARRPCPAAARLEAGARARPLQAACALSAPVASRC